MSLNPQLKKLMEQDMLTLPFVKWDRYFEDGQGATVFGWIDRDYDSYKDYVQLTYEYEKTVNRTHHYSMRQSTSSAKYSEKIGDLLKMSQAHNPCKRVEHNFNIKNMIKLENEVLQ